MSDENDEPLPKEEKIVKKSIKPTAKKSAKPSTYGLGQHLGAEILKHHSSDENQGSPDFKFPEPKLSENEEENDGDFIITKKLFR